MSMAVDLKSRFDREVAADGGVADPSRMPDPLDQLLADVLVEFRTMLESTLNSRPPAYVAHNIYIDLVENPSLNAVAFCSDGHEFIGVNVGTVMFLYDAFLSLFSHPRFMPDIGNAKAENSTDDALRLWLRRPHITHFHEYSPDDPQRVRAAQYMTINAYNFIFAHEVGHHTKGHLQYLKQKYGILRHRSYEDSAMHLIDLRARHALELGADENGAHGSLHIFRPQEAGAVFQNAGGLLRDCRTWTIAIGIVFALFDRHIEHHRPGAMVSHPTPDMRFLNVLWSAWEELNKVVPKSADAMIKQSLKASMELSEFFARLGLSKRPFSITDRKASIRDDLIAQVASVREELLKIESAGMESLAKQRSEDLRRSSATN